MFPWFQYTVFLIQGNTNDQGASQAALAALLANARETGSIPGSGGSPGGSPGGGHGNPLQHSCLENSMGVVCSPGGCTGRSD